MTDSWPGGALSRNDASGGVESVGWRYLIDTLVASVPVTTLEQGAGLVPAVLAACGADADGHLRADLRPERVELSLQDRALGAVTARDVELARSISDALAERRAGVAGPTSNDSRRPVQTLELAIDALDISAVRPFWQAVMAMVDQPGQGGPEGGLIDPAGQLPTIWFQQMDAPRPQRNRIHFDIVVAHDEAEARVRAALDAGGILVNDAHARSFWVLSDAEGNEICVCTWQDRD